MDRNKALELILVAREAYEMLGGRAREDGVEEAHVWALFAAHGPPDPQTLGCLSDLDAADRAEATAQWADLMLAEYRKRFPTEE